MQKALIVIGLIIVIVGLTWPWLKVFPFGQLPGDIAYKGDNFRVYFPITTMLIVSAVLSLIFWFFR